MDSISPLIAAILIMFGGLMAFMGSKYFFLVISALTGIALTVLLFLGTYNLFLDPKSTWKVTLILLFVFSVAIGVRFALWSYKYSKNFKKFAVWMIAIAFGEVAGMFLIGSFNLKFKGAAYAFGALLGYFAGTYILNLSRRLVKSVATALIGSFLFVRGVGIYAGGYPSEITFVNDDAKDGDL